jgi:hypothetical protein
MTNLLYSVLGVPNISYHYKLVIYKPFDDTIYKSWTTDKISLEANQDAVGEISSVSGSTNLESSPVEISQILIVPFTRRLIYSRQIQGWPVKLFVVTKGLTIADTKTLQIFKGIIGKIDIKGNRSSVEVVGDYEKLKQPSRYKLSTSCTREFGDSKCGVNRAQVVRSVLSLSEHSLQINLPITVTAPNQYEVSIGDDNYMLVDYNSSTLTLQLDRAPLAMPDVVVIRKSCDRKLETCLAYNNNAKFLGVIGLPSNALSIRL